MKVLIVVALTTITLISAEPPRGFRRQFFQRQEQQPSDIAPPPAPPNGADSGGPYPASSGPSDSAPYPASGWKPQGAEFNYPEKQPQNQYGAPPQQPQNQYGPPEKPSNQYGPPDNQKVSSTTPSVPATETETSTDSTTQEPEAETVSFRGKLRKPSKLQRQQESLIQNSDRGLYYVLLPDGRLQRVLYMTSADLQNMAYTARLRYEDVDPVSAPIFTLNNAPVPIPAASPTAIRLTAAGVPFQAVVGNSS